MISAVEQFNPRHRRWSECCEAANVLIDAGIQMRTCHTRFKQQSKRSIVNIESHGRTIKDRRAGFVGSLLNTKVKTAQTLLCLKANLTVVQKTTKYTN